MKTVGKKVKRNALILAYVGLCALPAVAQRTSDFEKLPLKPNSFWNGSDKSGGFEDGEIVLKNKYNSDWGSWSGFAYSNMADVTTEGFANQYSSYAGSGALGSSNFVVAYSNQVINYKALGKGCKPKGVYITNNTYVALEMKNGSKFSKKFGGTTGNDPDFFLLKIINYAQGKKNDTVAVYLADYRADDNAKDYILNTWKYIDLSKFHYSDSIGFNLSSSDNGSFGMNTPSYFCIDNFTLVPAPFAPIAGVIGSTAIAQESTSIKSWATAIEVKRGLKIISVPDSGFATFGLPDNALGKAGENGLVSLGDKGIATLTFANKIANGAGADFAIFENAFIDDFLELAFVEVSSDGRRYVRFPATSYTDTSEQVGGFGKVDARMLNNLAGKYKGGFGTPFDLEELKDSLGIDITAISHIRIIDVVGSIDSKFGSRDALGQLINDLWATPFASSGFDLDAVGVINEAAPNAVEAILASNAINTYPNPVNNGTNINIASSANSIQYQMYNATGSLVQNGSNASVATADLPKGMYLLQVQTEAGKWSGKVVVE